MIFSSLRQAPRMRRRHASLVLLAFLLSMLSVPASPLAVRPVAAAPDPTDAGTPDLLLLSSDWSGAGVWLWHQGSWSLKSTGLPTSGWRGIVADSFDRTRWLVWNDTTVYLTTNSGASWTATDDVLPGQGGDHFIQNASFSTTDPGVWSVVSRFYDRFYMCTLGAITRGQGTQVTSTYAWLGECGSRSGPQNDPTALLPLPDGGLVVATTYSDHVLGAWRQLPSGAVTGAGSAFFLANMNFAQVDGLPATGAVAGVPSSATDGADYGSLWYTPDARTTPPVALLRGQPWGWKAVATMATDGVFVMGNDGVYQVRNLGPAPEVTRVVSGTGLRWLRSDRQTHTAVAVYAGDANQVYVRPAPGAAWQAIGLPSPGWNFADRLEVLSGTPQPLKVEITDAQGKVVRALTNNDEGWPVLDADTGTIANPLTVKVTVQKQSDDDNLLAIDFGSPNRSTRFYPITDPASIGCGADEAYPKDAAAMFSYRHVRMACDVRMLTTGESRNLSWQIWIQPSSDGPFDVEATLLDGFTATDTTHAAAEIQVPLAHIRPVIFIPGIAGSYLNDRALMVGANLWPGVRDSHYDRLTLYQDHLDGLWIKPDIIATDAVRRAFGLIDAYGSLLETLQKLGYSEYQVNGDPAKRTLNGCDEMQRLSQPQLFVFAYDWRLNNDHNSVLLDSYVQCIRTFYTPNTQVDMVVHSMGGLIARRYILDHPGVVNRLVSIATPWLGAPKAINTLETGEFLGFRDHRLLIRESELKSMVGSFAGAVQLAPSQGYYDLLKADAPQPLVEDGIDWNENGSFSDTYSYADQVSVLDHRFGRGVYADGTIGKAFHDYTTAFGKQDDWRIDSTGVKYYQIYGQTKDNTTIVQVRPSSGIYCISDEHPGIGWYCSVAGFKTMLRFGPGDGTVPLLSAKRIGDGNVDYAPNVVRHCAQTGGKTHTGLPANPEVQHQIELYLTGRIALLVNHPKCPEEEENQKSQGLSVDAAQPFHASAMLRAQATLPTRALTSTSETGSPSAYYLTIDNLPSSSIVVSDTLGHSTALISDTFRGDVPGVTMVHNGEKSETIIIPTTGIFTVTFQTSHEPIAIETRVGTGDTTTQRIRYADLTLPISVTAQLTFTPQGAAPLRYDQQGDGTFAALVMPKVDVSGAMAQDQDAPTIRMSQTAQSNQVLITLDAQDSGSGVQAVYYSFDGAHFQHYSEPFAINPATVSRIYAFADDQVGNRSGLLDKATISINEH